MRLLYDPAYRVEGNVCLVALLASSSFYISLWLGDELAQLIHIPSMVGRRSRLFFPADRAQSGLQSSWSSGLRRCSFVRAIIRLLRSIVGWARYSIERMTR